MNEEIVSIIIPVYNVELYITRCIDSIVAQTYYNIEILLIDDGSPDNSGAICDEYAAKDSRIKVFHIPNGGVAKARQLGVENSTGDYIVFVDSDDWLPLDSIEILYSNLTDDVDIVIGSSNNYIADNYIYKALPYKVYDNDEYTSITIAFDIIGYPWGRIFRRSLFNKDSFPNIRRAQDWLMNIDIAIRCRRVKTIPNSVYNYVIASTSSTYREFKLSFDFYKKLCLLVKDKLTKEGIYDRYVFSYGRTALRIFYYDVIYNNIEFDRADKVIKEIVKILSDNTRNLSIKEYVGYLSIKYQIIANLSTIAIKLKRKLDLIKK